MCRPEKIRLVRVIRGLQRSVGPVASTLDPMASFSILVATWPARFRSRSCSRGGRIDVRRVGSRNVGAANVLRNTGVGGRCWSGCSTSPRARRQSASRSRRPGQRCGGVDRSRCGRRTHLSRWLRFHGGKGVAVAAGVFAILTPLATAIAMTFFLVIVSATRYVSLGSVAATLRCRRPPGSPARRAPLSAPPPERPPDPFRHRANLSRLTEGTERRL